MKIAFLGASMTEGVYGVSYVDLVRQQLPQDEIINAGVGGNTLNRMLERLDDVLDQHSPDAVFVMGGSNDAIAYSQPKTRPYYKQVQNLPNGFLSLEEYGQLYRDLLTQLQLAHVQPFIGLPPMEYNPALIQASNAFNQEAQNVGRAMNVPVCDLASALSPAPESVPDRPELDMRMIFLIGERTKTRWNDYETARQREGYHYSFDGIHLTQIGAKKIADIISDFINQHR